LLPVGRHNLRLLIWPFENDFVLVETPKDNLSLLNTEGHASPEIARDSEVTLKAVKELEQGWHKAIDEIAERAGRAKGPDTRR
jgi:hypothetical protein